MKSIFSFNTLYSQLKSENRTLEIRMNRADRGNPLTLEFLFELESLLQWALPKVEIQNIFIGSDVPLFSIGLNLESLNVYSESKLEKIHLQLNKVCKSMLEAPQTIVVDLGERCENIATELAAAADIRIASKNAKINLNHIELGLPQFINQELMLSAMGKSTAALAQTTCLPVPTVKLYQGGFLSELYSNEEERQETVNRLLGSVNDKSNVSRIQNKLALNLPILDILDISFQEHFKIFKGALSTQDWTKREHTNPEVKGHQFEAPRDFKKKVKMTLIKNDDLEIN